MAGEVIEFPGGRKKKSPDEQTVEAPVTIFCFTDSGQVDLAEGLSVTDAVTAFWEALGDVVRETWAEEPLSQERARTRLLEAFLDKKHPGWRQEIMWSL